MRYGHFDDAAKEYVIETPATPLPWINYLGNEDFFSLISNTGGGYSFYKDAKLRRITRYRYNNVPADNGSRCYYLSLMDSDSADAKPVETWSPTFLPCKTPLDSYKCRQGIGYTVFEASKRGIESKLTAFVPLHTNAEINRLDVTNTTDEPAVIDVTGSVEWCLWNAVDDSSNFQRNLSTGEVEIERETDATLLYHKTEFKERRNHYAFYGVNAPVVGFDTSRDEFLGQFNGWDTPQVIAEGKAHDSVAHGWFPIAANRVRLELQPGETASLVFMLGYIEVAKDQKWEDPNDPAKVGIINKKPAHELFRRFATVEQVEAALKELNSYWSELLTTYSVDSGDEKLDRMVNIWHQYQCMVTFNMSRSASYYESGMGRGMGFRDSNQDLLGFVHLIPERARERIIDIASTQMEDGSAWHQYQPLIGRADWNDCLNLNCFSDTPGESFQTVENNDTGVAESVFIGGMFVPYGSQYADILEHYGRLAGMSDAEIASEAASVRAEIGQVSKAVKTAGWDGEWFVRAYDAYSRKVGTHEDTEGQIYIEPQGMCVMAGIGLDDGKAQQALKSVKERLTCDWGTAILAPAYSTYRIELGEISSYPRGYKENGGIFCHNNPWISIANAIAGNDDEAFAVYQRNCPAYVEDKSDVRKVEPYVYCQMVAGPEAATPGEGKNSWLTGTAAWTFVDVSQYLLGVRPTLDGLAIEPHLPERFDQLTVTRVFRGVTYRIAMKRTGERTVSVDGAKIGGNVVPALSDAKSVDVEVTF